ncbi:S4 domain-containing protein, partial [Borreliella garinii]
MIALKTPRVQVFLAEKGVGSRRFCEELIKKKLVRVNGSIAKLGDKVALGDRITYKKQIYVFTDFQSKSKIYLALNKPKNYLCSNFDVNG